MKQLIGVILACLVTLSAFARPEPETREFRGMWVTRWDFRAPADVTRAVQEAKSVGVTDLFWQARGQADAFYASDLEPWGRELFRDLPPGTSAPSFDPLALATKEAHARGMKIHAWVNVMPLWKGMTAPEDPKHPYNAHPQWRLYDSKGKQQALNDHYVIINPLSTEAQDHVAKVCADIMTRYPVDGLHLDYIRFVSETMKDASVFPGDETSVAQFTAATKRPGIATTEDKAAYRAFIRDRISDLVRRLKKDLVSRRPGAVLTAAVWRRPELGRDTYLQDAAQWVKDGTLDRALPMIYNKDDKIVQSDIDAWVQAIGPSNLNKLTPGLGSYLLTPHQTPHQIELCRKAGAAGYSLFSYNSFYESVNPDQEKDETNVKLRSERLLDLKAFLGIK